MIILRFTYFSVSLWLKKDCSGNVIKPSVKLYNGDVETQTSVTSHPFFLAFWLTRNIYRFRLAPQHYKIRKEYHILWWWLIHSFWFFLFVMRMVMSSLGRKIDLGQLLNEISQTICFGSSGIFFSLSTCSSWIWVKKLKLFFLLYFICVLFPRSKRSWCSSSPCRHNHTLSSSHTSIN